MISWRTLLLPMYVVACGSNATPPGRETQDDRDRDAATQVPDAGRTPRGRDPFNGDCTTAKWSSSASDGCWACMCSACAATLNKCNDDCVDLFQCGLDNDVAVGTTAELECEGRAFEATCLKDPAKRPHAEAVTAFDVCLIGARTPQSMLRICEAECNVKYTGDVCERFPPP